MYNTGSLPVILLSSLRSLLSTAPHLSASLHTCLSLPLLSLTHLVNIRRPGGEDHVTGLLVEGEPLDVDVADGGEDGVGQQGGGAVVFDNNVGVDHGVLVASVCPGGGEGGGGGGGGLVEGDDLG